MSPADTNAIMLSPCASQDEEEYGAAFSSSGGRRPPMSPPRSMITKEEGIEVVMPPSPTSTMDVFLLMDHDDSNSNQTLIQQQHQQHIALNNNKKPVPIVEDFSSLFYVSDASETLSVRTGGGISVESASLLGPYLLELEQEEDEEGELMVINPTTTNTTIGRNSSNTTNHKKVQPPLKEGIPNTVFQVNKEHHHDLLAPPSPGVISVGMGTQIIQYNYSDDEEEEELLGLRCLPETILCAPLGGFLDDESWDDFWGTVNACSVGTPAQSTTTTTTTTTTTPSPSVVIGQRW